MIFFGSISLLALALFSCGEDSKSTPAVKSYKVGGTVTGITGELVLKINGGDKETINADGIYYFDTKLEDGTDYEVTSQPPFGQSCTIEHVTGTIDGADISNVDVNCS